MPDGSGIVRIALESDLDHDGRSEEAESDGSDERARVSFNAA